MANVKPIRTEQDYEAALARVDELIDAGHGSPEDGTKMAAGQSPKWSAPNRGYR